MGDRALSISAQVPGASRGEHDQEAGIKSRAKTFTQALLQDAGIPSSDLFNGCAKQPAKFSFIFYFGFQS